MQSLLHGEFARASQAERLAARPPDRGRSDPAPHIRFTALGYIISTLRRRRARDQRPAARHLELDA
jgi:hypothetical protein